MSRDDERPVIGYVRVSTARQASEGVSLEAQRARIEAWAQAQGLELAEVHVDDGVSGGKMTNRPGLQAALTDTCQRRGVLVTYSLSRLARSTKDALGISERLDKAGADLVSLSESIDTTSAAGKMVFRMLAVLAEFERDLISERTTSALAYKRQQGRRISLKVPFGYRDDGSGNLVEIPEQREAVAFMQGLRGDGYSLRQIGRSLERAGIKRQNGAETWPPNVIRMILIRATKETEPLVFAAFPARRKLA